MRGIGAISMAGSFVLTGFVLGNAYFQKKQFYPSVVYITKSNTSMAVLYLQAFVFIILFAKLLRKVFFGQLRAAEMEHLIERSWYAVTETCLAFTVFRDDFSTRFVIMFTFLLFLKCFHWLAEDRVDYMESSPLISWMFHIRAISLLSFLALFDFLFISHAYYSTIVKGASVQLVFGFEYAILLTILFSIIIKYILHTIDLQNENPWENKAVYLLYTELCLGFIKVILYSAFMVIMIKVHTFPLFAIRPMYLTIRSFKKALNDVIMSRRAIRNMNSMYPDATPEDLQQGDNVCIICREEMLLNCKKLPCNHIFHISCLRSWFQRQQTCPTCRMDILRVTRPNTTPAGQQQVPQAQANGNVFQPNMFQFPGWQMPNMANLQMPNMGNAQVPNMAQNAGATPAQSTATPTSTTTTSSAQAGSTTQGFPMGSYPYYMPPMYMPPMYYPYQPPIPQPDLRTYSDEQLREMEGNLRETMEAKAQLLQHIQTLLEVTYAEMQQFMALQYMSSMQMQGAATSTTTATPNPPSEATSPSSRPKQTEDISPETVENLSRMTESIDSTLEGAVGFTIPKEELIPSGDSDEEADRRELRRRRLDKFEKQLSNSSPEED